MPNYFDKYDSPTPTPAPAPGAGGGNYFDKYDSPEPAEPADLTSPSPPTPETDAALENVNKFLRAPSPPWLQKFEEPAREFLNQPLISRLPPEETRRIVAAQYGKLPEQIPQPTIPPGLESSAAAAESYARMVTPANAVIATAMAAQPETIPYLFPMFMAPVVQHAMETGGKMIQGKATPEEQGQLAADVGLLAAPGVHVMAPRLGGGVAAPLPRPPLQAVSPVLWQARYGEIPGVEYKAGEPVESVGEPITATEGGETGATKVESGGPVPELEVRPRMGEAPPLRREPEGPPGEGAQPGPTGEAVVPEVPAAPEAQRIKALRQEISSYKSRGLPIPLAMTQELEQLQAAHPEAEVALPEVAPSGKGPAMDNTSRLVETGNLADDLQDQLLQIKHSNLDENLKKKMLQEVSEKLSRAYDEQHRQLDESGEPREVAVIGGGAGGLAAATHASYEGADTVLFEASPSVGGASKRSGEILNASGRSEAQTGREKWAEAENLARTAGVDIRLGVKINSFNYDPETGLTTLTTDTGKQYQFRKVVGAQGRRPMIYPELGNSKQVVYGNGEKVNKLGEGGNVVYLGGANSATQAALTSAANPKIKGVYIITRSPLEGSANQIRRVRNNPKIHITEGDHVTWNRDKTAKGRIVTDKDNNVVAVETANGLRIPAKAVGVFQQQILNTEVYPVGTLNERGLVIVDPQNLKTTQPNLSAVGDIIDKPRDPRIQTAAQEGLHVAARVTNELAHEHGEGKFDSSWRRAVAIRESARGQKLAEHLTTGVTPGTGLTETKTPSGGMLSSKKVSGTTSGTRSAVEDSQGQKLDFSQVEQAGKLPPEKPKKPRIEVAPTDYLAPTSPQQGQEQQKSGLIVPPPAQRQPGKFRSEPIPGEGEPVTRFPEGAIEEGLNQEHPDVAKHIDRYVMDNDPSGIFAAMKDPGYEAYRNDLHRLLRSVYGDKIPVTRVAGYAPGAVGAGKSGGLAYVSVSTNPTWGEGLARKGLPVWKGTIKPEDVVLAGHEAEGELIVKSKAVNVYEPGEPVTQAPGELRESVQEANARLSENPLYVDNLVVGLKTGEKTSLDAADESALVQRLGELQAARNRMGKTAMDQTVEAGERAEAGRNFDDMDSQVRTMEDATQDGQILKEPAQTMMWHTFRARDYDFPAMEQKISVARNGAALSASEKQALKNKTDTFSNRQADVENAMRRTGFTPGRPNPRSQPGYEQVRQAQLEMQRAKDVLDDQVWKERLIQKGYLARGAHLTHEIIAAQRALLTAADFSAVRRQGGVIMMAHPVRAFRGMPDMFKAAVSDANYFKLMQDIREDPEVQFGVQNGLSITDVKSPNLSQMEEAYMSRWANNLPVLASSQRAYVYFLNRLRSDSYKAMARDLTNSGIPTANQAKAISNFVNVFTGRGKLPGDYAMAAAALNDVLFAPRYMASRFQVLTGQPIRYAAKLDPKVRELIAKEYARTLMGYGVVYGLAMTAGSQFVDVGTDWTNADFGKLIIKGTNTRIDFLSGLSQPTVYMARMGAMTYEQVKTQMQTGHPKKLPLTAKTPMSVTQDFLRSKYAPLPSMYFNVAQGQKVTGEPATIQSELVDQVTPITGQDILTSLENYGVPEGAALSLISVFGDNVQTYSPKVKTRSRSQHRTR